MSEKNDEKSTPLMASVYVIYDTRGITPYFRCNIYVPRDFFTKEEQKNMPKQQKKPIYDDKDEKCYRIFYDEESYLKFLERKIGIKKN